MFYKLVNFTVALALALAGRGGTAETSGPPTHFPLCLICLVHKSGVGGSLCRSNVLGFRKLREGQRRVQDFRSGFRTTAHQLPLDSVSSAFCLGTEEEETPLTRTCEYIPREDMPQPSRVLRIVHRQAAAAVSRLLEADASKRGGVSIKALTLSPSVLSKKATHALTCETLRCEF